MRAINLRNEELKNGWCLCHLPDFTHIEMGQSPPSTTYNQDGVGLPFFQGKAEFTELYPEIDKYCSAPNKIAKAGATLLTVRAPVGPTNLAQVDCCIGRGLAGLHPLDDIEPKFILFLMRSIESDISDKGTGSTFTAINKTFLEELVIALPPLNEQKRIVAKIEELFSELDKGIENLTTAREQLKIYRQAILKQAFEGNLTADWREKNKDKLETPEQLSAGIYKEREKHKTQKRIDTFTDAEILELPALPEAWLWKKLGELSVKITDGEHFKPPVQDKGVYFLSAKDVRDEGVSFDDPLYVSQETAHKARLRCNPESGDLLIVSRGATVGRMCTVNTDKLFCLLGSVILIKPTSAVNGKFLSFALKSPTISRKIISVSGATAQQAIYLRDIQHVATPLCSLEEQLEIVKILEEKFSIISALHQEIEDNLQKSEALRKSILQKAFSGQLVVQDPNDEPASVLLERIRAGKEGHAKPQRKRRAA